MSSTSGALGRNQLGKGQFYYIGSRNDFRFHADFSRHLIDSLKLPRAVPKELADGGTSLIRSDGKREFLFLLNFTHQPQEIVLGLTSRIDMLDGGVIHNSLGLGGYAARVLRNA